MAMLDLLAVHRRGTGEVVEVVTLDRSKYSDDKEFIAAVEVQAKALKKRHALPAVHLDFFEGSARSVDGFFAYFREVKRTPDTKVTSGDEGPPS